MCGNELLQSEVDEIDQKIKDVCPSDVLCVDGVLLRRTSHPSSHNKLPLPAAQCQHQLNDDIRTSSGVQSDLGSINSKGLLELGNFSRPLYPWETQEGMKWLQTL